MLFLAPDLICKTPRSKHFGNNISSKEEETSPSTLLPGAVSVSVFLILIWDSVLCHESIARNATSLAMSLPVCVWSWQQQLPWFSSEAAQSLVGLLSLGRTTAQGSREHRRTGWASPFGKKRKQQDWATPEQFLLPNSPKEKNATSTEAKSGRWESTDVTLISVPIHGREQ